MKIESIRIKNFRVFQDVTIERLQQMCVFVGANGSGKSTLFDVFGFLRDSLIHNVRSAFHHLVDRLQLMAWPSRKSSVPTVATSS